MAGACNIIRNDKNEILWAEASNGSRSTLFDSIAEKEGNTQDALPIWLVSKTKRFKDEVVFPKLNAYRATLMNKLNSLTVKATTLEPLDAKGVKLDLTDLGYTNTKGAPVGTKTLSTITAFANPVEGGKGVSLGRIRYQIKGDTLVIDSSALSPIERYDKGTIKSIKGLGIGGKLYAEVIKFAMQNDLKVESSDNLSPESTALWNKLTRIGLATKTDEVYSVNMFPPGFDSNGEINMAPLVDFIDREGVDTGLTAEDTAELKTLMVGLPVKSSEELTYKLKKGFMSKGYFAPTRKALLATEMYSSEEVTDIMTNLELQLKIRDYIYKLEDIDTPILNDVYANPIYLTVKTGVKNSIGKFDKNNPYIVEKEIIEKLGGIEIRSEFEEAMMDDEVASGTVAHVYTDLLETRDDLFNSLSKFKPVGAVSIEDGVLVPKTSDTRERMEQTLMDAPNDSIEKNLDFLVNLDDSMWVEAPKEVTTLLNEAKKGMAEIGIDATDLIKVAKKKSIGETKEFLRAARNAAIELNEETYDALTSEYNEYFDVDESFKYEKVRLGNNITKDNTFFLKSDLSGPEAFLQADLIPVGVNVYKRVRPQTSDQLIDAIINMSFASNGYETIVPLEAFKPAGYDADGRVNMAKMQNRDNALALRNSLVNWVDGQVKELYGEKLNNVEVEDLKKYVLYFNYYNKDTNYNKFDNNPTMATDYSLISDPVTNTEYLTGDFIGDFNSKIIKEKQSNTEAYQNFYSNFKIDKNGISLVNDDPISRSQMEPYFEDNKDLVNYFRINKKVDNLVDDRVEDPIGDDLYRRNYYSNYPTALKSFKGEYSKLTRNTLAAKSKAPFIRTFDGVFELVQGMGRISLYGRIETNTGQYKMYNNNMAPPTLDASAKSLNGIDTNIQDVTKVTQLYNEAEEKRINDKYDNCK